jgi:hypothetical protein
MFKTHNNVLMDSYENCGDGDQDEILIEVGNTDKEY